MNYTINIEKPPYKPWGRYVCDWNCYELHLFDTKPEAVNFATSWERNCNVGWLAPVLDTKTGRNRKPTFYEARLQIARGAFVTDHRKETS